MSAEKANLLPEQDQLELAVLLYRGGLFGIKTSRELYKPLTSGGRLSPHYFNPRDAISDYEIRNKLADVLLELAAARAKQKGFDSIRDAYDHFAPTPQTMTSVVTTMADKLPEIGLLLPRVGIEEDKLVITSIHGHYTSTDHVAQFDNAIGAGDTTLRMIGVHRAACLFVADYFVLLNREEGGVPRVQQETGIEMTEALGLSRMMNMLRDEGELKTGEYEVVAEYLSVYGEPQARIAVGVDF